MIRRLDDRLTVSGQIGPDQVPALAEAGVSVLINNRPDGEEAGQPQSQDIRAAAEAAGLAYVHAPFAGRPSEAEADIVRLALAGTEGGVHAFCRSGMRSTAAWALMAVRDGTPVEEVLSTGRAAGYDLAALFT